MPRSVLRVGTRGSALALAQAESIRQAIAQVITHRNFELVPVTTAGDAWEGDAPAARADGLLVGEIEEALVLGKIDLAVHSAEDLPDRSREGVTLGAIAGREDPREALVTRSGSGLVALQPGTSIGTASLARASQIRAWQRGLVPTPIEGNLDARLRKLSDGEVSALIVSLASLQRLGRADRAAEILPINQLLPAPGQGALAVQCRSNDKMMRPAVQQLEDAGSRAAFEAERSFQLSIDARVPVGIAALAEAVDDRVRLRGLVASPDGTRIVTDQVEGSDAEKVGILLAERLRELGLETVVAAARAAQAG